MISRTENVSDELLINFVESQISLRKAIIYGIKSVGDGSVFGSCEHEEILVYDESDFVRIARLFDKLDNIHHTKTDTSFYSTFTIHDIGFVTFYHKEGLIDELITSN